MKRQKHTTRTTKHKHTKRQDKETESNNETENEVIR